MTPWIPADRSYSVDTEELDRAECLRLLATSTVGRLVVTDGALPAAYPVPYLLDGEAILVRAAPATRLAGIRHDVVGFQVDDIDSASFTGWSVLAVGEAAEATDPDPLPDFWRPHVTERTVRIPLQRLSGQRVHRRLARYGPSAVPPSDRRDGSVRETQ